jgi:hypothetical protein
MDPTEPLNTSDDLEAVPTLEGEEAPLVPPGIARWVKTECGRAKYQELASRKGAWAGLRRWWFVWIAALRDWRLPPSALP